MAKSKYRIMIIEPSPLIREGLQQLLNAEWKENTTHSFSDFLQFEKSSTSQHADLFLINPSVLEHGKRLQLVQSYPFLEDKAKIALVTQYIDEETLSQFDAKIELFDDIDKIQRSIKHVLEHSEPVAKTETADDHGLSEREKEILVSVAKGLSNKEIADVHHISINTVITHRKNITRKTNIKTVAGLTMYAVLNNWVQL